MLDEKQGLQVLLPVILDPGLFSRFIKAILNIVPEVLGLEKSSHLDAPVVVVVTFEGGQRGLTDAHYVAVGGIEGKRKLDVSDATDGIREVEQSMRVLKSEETLLKKCEELTKEMKCKAVNFLAHMET